MLLYVTDFCLIQICHTNREGYKPNTTWSIDFVSDRLQSGRTFRVLNIIDDCDRVAVGQEISMSMPTERVIKLLEKVIWLSGA